MTSAKSFFAPGPDDGAPLPAGRDFEQKLQEHRMSLWSSIKSAVTDVIGKARYWEQVKADLKRMEGLRLIGYRDTGGIPTIGYGHTHKDVYVGQKITQERAESFLEADMKTAVEDAKKVYPKFEQLDHVRQGVLVNMAFNLGQRNLSTFRSTLTAIEEGRYDDAALQMMMSKWSGQVKGRALELAKRILTGRIDPRWDVVAQAKVQNEKAGK